MAAAILKAGCNAVLDSFTGLVPVEVLSVGQNLTKFRVTSTRGAYKRGDVDASSNIRVIPVGAVQRRSYHNVILPYEIEVTQ